MYSLNFRKHSHYIKPRYQGILHFGADVIFQCRASTDLREAEHLTYEWTRDGDEIDFENEPRFVFNATDHSLTIMGVEESDFGVYTCTADNGIDSDEAGASLEGKSLRYMTPIKPLL